MDDLISRQAALEKVRAMQTYKLFKNDDMLLVDKAEVQTELMMLPSVQPEVLACGNGELVAQPELTDEQVIDYCKKKGYKIVADDLFDLLSKLEPHWIPVEKELPEPRIDVWVNSDLGQMVGYYDEMVNLWYGRDYLELIVNAWMPLPEPYKPNK